MARYNEPNPTPVPPRPTPQPDATTPTEHDRHATANADLVRLLRAHLTGGKPC